MATFTERLRIIIDTQTDKAVTGLKSIQTEVKNAEGFFGKAKAGAKGLADQLSGNPTAMAGAAAAAYGELFKLAGQASNTGVEIGKLKDATGLSADAASRWTEVAGDMHIDNLAGLIEKMTVNLGKSPDKFEAMGIAVKHARDGSVDMNDTLLNAIDVISKIQDPTDRAKASQELFGKAYADASELIAAGADKVKASLAGVAGGAIFSDKEIKQARDFRDMMSKLEDVGQHLSLAIGKGVMPIISRLGDELAHVGDVMDKLPIPKLIQGMNDLASPIAAATDTLDTMKQHMGKALETQPLDEWLKHVQRFNGPELAHQVKLWADAHQDSGITIDELTALVNTHSTSVGKLRDDEITGATAADDYAVSVEAIKKAADDSKKALDDLKQSTEDIYKGEYDKIQAHKDYATALQGLNDAIHGKGGQSIPDALQNAAEKFAEVNGHAKDTKEGITDQIAFLSTIETGYKKGSPAWNAIEDMKNQLLGAQTIAQQKVTAEVIGLNPQAQNAIANGGTWIGEVHVTVSDPSPQAVINAIIAWQRRNGAIPRF